MYLAKDFLAAGLVESLLPNELEGSMMTSEIVLAWLANISKVHKLKQENIPNCH